MRSESVLTDQREGEFSFGIQYFPCSCILVYKFLILSYFWLSVNYVLVIQCTLNHGFSFTCHNLELVFEWSCVLPCTQIFLIHYRNNYKFYFTTTLIPNQRSCQCLLFREQSNDLFSISFRPDEFSKYDLGASRS